MWFGCDVTKSFATKPGLADTNAHDWKLLYGTTVNEVLSKADRLIYGESEMTHAMVITGVQTDVSYYYRRYSRMSIVLLGTVTKCTGPSTSTGNDVTFREELPQPWPH